MNEEMDELISRKAVLDFTTEWCNRCGKNKQNNGVMCGCCDLADTIDFIEELPTIPQTNTAEWEFREILQTNIIGWWCSNCHIGEKTQSAYCPNCGAAMRKKSEEEE